MWGSLAGLLELQEEHVAGRKPSLCFLDHAFRVWLLTHLDLERSDADSRSVSDADDSHSLSRGILRVGAKNPKHSGAMGFKLGSKGEVPELAADLTIEVFMIEQPASFHIHDADALATPPFETPGKPRVHSARHLEAGIGWTKVDLTFIPGPSRPTGVRGALDAALLFQA